VVNGPTRSSHVKPVLHGCRRTLLMVSVTSILFLQLAGSTRGQRGGGG
jgi:hypothetical protein